VEVDLVADDGGGNCWIPVVTMRISSSSSSLSSSPSINEGDCRGGLLPYSCCVCVCVVEFDCDVDVELDGDFE